jgi:hypothetical protein
MLPDTTLTLGDFAFAHTEIPEQISFGGEHKLAVHELVGGVRVIDALGRADTALTWQGWFTGQHALERARYLDGLRMAGQPLSLTWAAFAYRVLIRSFTADYQRTYQMPYRIECDVLDDLTQAVTVIASPGIDAWITADLAQADGLVNQIGDGPLSALFSALHQAMRTVGRLATAVSNTLNKVLQPLAAIRVHLNILLTQVNAVVHNATTLGGLLPDSSIAQQARRLLTHTQAMAQLPRLIQLDRVLGRLSTNVISVSSSARQVTVAGGNLYALAVQEYGKASAWQTIAEANGLDDPVLQGIHTLTIPPLSRTISTLRTETHDA